MSALSIGKKGLNLAKFGYTQGVKHRFIALCIFALPHFAGTLRAQPALSSQEIKNVNGTTDTTVNAALPPAPATFNLTGLVTGTAAFYAGVTATTTDGVSSYSGSVDFLSNNYRVKVPPGSYQLSVSYVASLTAVTGISTYNDPAVVQVSGDTVHPINVVATVNRNISGVVAGLDPRFTSTNLLFSSTAASAGLSLNTAKLHADGTYTGSLPDGTYAALLLSATKDTSSVTSINLGNVTVAGADLTANFTAPGISALSGTVVTADGTPIQTGSSVIAFDGNLLSLVLNPSTNNFPLFSFGSGTVDMTSGAYQALLPTGRQYTLAVGLNILTATPAQDSGTLEMILPNTTSLPGDTTQNITVPALPGTVNLSGKVVDPTGAPVVSASITATTAQVSGFPSTTVIFTRSTQTDASGNYLLTVLNGQNYDMVFTPPSGGLSGLLKAPNLVTQVRKLITPSPDKGLSHLPR